MTAKLDPLLLDVLVALHEACVRCEEAAAQTSLEKLESEVFSQLAMAKAVEQIGEISHRILRRYPSFAEMHSDIPFRYAFQLRNRIAHGYETLDWPVLWEIAVRRVPELRLMLEPIVADDSEDHSKL